MSVEERRVQMTGNEKRGDRMAAWPESARRYVGVLKRALAICRADLAHYVDIVEQHEYDWFEQDVQQGQVEALTLERDELNIECEMLRERLRATRLAASPCLHQQDVAGSSRPLAGALNDQLRDSAGRKTAHVEQARRNRECLQH